MKQMFRYGMILSMICMVASAALATVNALTKERIIAQAKAEEEASLKEVMPEGQRFEAVKQNEELLYYTIVGNDDSRIGVAFKASAKGYSSIIETIVGMKEDGTITAIKVISQNETPGLGARVAEPSFTGQFSQKTIGTLGQVQAITGATISSKAVMDSVKLKAEEIKELLENEK